MENTYSTCDIEGDGVIYVNGIKGLISYTPFLLEELPSNSYIYLLQRPKYRRHSWLLESIDETTDTCQQADADLYEEERSMAYVCFVEELEFNSLIFDDDDYDIYIEWNSQCTMADIMEYNNEEEE